ncbi:hypothetical protein D3C81_2236420 [compost metagenome]
MLTRPFIENHIDHQPRLIEGQILHLQAQSGADRAGAAITGQHIVRRHRTLGSVFGPNPHIRLRACGIDRQNL